MQPPLERHVVVGDALVEGRIFGWRGRRGLAGSGGRPGGAARHGHGLLAVFVGGGAAALLTAAQKHEVLADDFGGVDLLAILIVVASGFQPAFHVDLLALKQVVGDVFRPPVFHAVPVGLFLPLSGLLVLPLSRGSPVQGVEGGAGARQISSPPALPSRPSTWLPRASGRTNNPE